MAEVGFRTPSKKKKVGFRNLRIPMKRIILMAPSTACSERIWHILTRMLVPTKLLGSFDLPLSGLLCFLTFLLILYSLILLIIEDDGFPKLKLLDGSETPPWWNPYRILFTVLCANQPFLVASLTATKCWKSIDLKHPPTEGRFIGRQIFLRTIPFLFPHLFHEDYLLSALPLSDWKRLTILIYLVNWFLLNRLFLKVIILARLQRPETGKKNKVNNVVVNNYTSGGSGYWESMDLEHPPLLKTLAIYTKLKGKISDLLKFVRGKNREENPLVEFDSTNNSAYESGLLVSNSEYTNSREESKRPCMTERVLGSVDSTTRISSTDFDAADNTAHLGRACQSGPVVSLSGNENSGEASKKECITKRMLGLEDLQQNSGGRHDNAAKSFGAIYDPGIHSTHSLAQNSFKVVEALPTRKQPNESVPLLSLGRLTLEGCVQEEKSQDLPRLMQIDGVEQRVTKSRLQRPDLLKFVWGKNREEKPLVEFDSTNNSAYQSGLLVSNSENTNSREESKRPCMTERVLGSVNSKTRILLKDFDAADNTAYLGRGCQSGPVVSLSGNENSGEASTRECITKRILGLEDPQQNSGGRRDNAAKSFGAIYDPGIHTTHSLAQNSFEVVEALPTRKQPNDSVPLLSLGRLTLEGCVQEEKSQDLSRLMQIDGVEQSVTKSTRYLEGFTAQSTSSSRWPISLPNGRHIVVLNLLEQSTKNVAHVAMADQCSPTVPLPEKKMVRRTLKRKYRIMSPIFSIHQQHFGKRCEGTAESCHAMRICRNHGINCVSMVKCIHKQHGINQWPFRQRRKSAFHKSPNLLFTFTVEKWATRKGHSLGEKRPYEVSTLSTDLPRSLKLDCSRGLGAQSAIGLPDGGYVLSVSEKKIVGKTLKRECKTMSLFSLEDDQRHGVRRWGDAVKSLGRKRICRQLVVQHVSRAKRIHRQHVFHRWPFQQSAVGLPDRGYVLSVLEKKIVGKTLKRKCKTMSLFSLENDQQHSVRRWGDAAKSLGRKRIFRQLVVQHVSRAKRIHRQHVFHRWPFQQNWETMKAYSVRDKRPAEVLSLSTDGKLVSRLQLVHISWLVKFLPRPSAYQGGGEIVGPIALLSSEFTATNNRAHEIRKDQSGSSSASHSEKKRPGEPEEDFEERDGSISYEDLQNLFGMNRDYAAKFLDVSLSTLKRNCRKHGIGRWPYQARKKAVKKPPDRHRGMNTSPTCKSVSTNGSNPASSQPKPTIPHATGSSDDRRNLLASQEESLLQHVSTPIYETISSRADPARSQPTPIVPHPTRNLEDQRNLLVSQEALLREHVSGPSYGTISPCTNPAPSQTTPVVPHPTGNLEDQTNFLALPEEPLLSQLPPSIAPTMGGFADWRALSAFLNDSFPEGPGSGSIDCTIPASSNPAPSQPMPTNATERQNTDFVELKATYGDTTIKFQLPPMFETSELKEKVSKILECELGSFKVEYKDKDGEWILMGCDENAREYLQLLKSLGKQVTKLKISDTNTTNLCETCGSLMRKRPRS